MSGENGALRQPEAGGVRPNSHHSFLTNHWALATGHFLRRGDLKAQQRLLNLILVLGCGKLNLRLGLLELRLA